jgi:hypothetical protein
MRDRDHSVAEVAHVLELLALDAALSGNTVHSSALLSIRLFGGANPGSRPNHCPATLVPGASSSGAGVPPSKPCAKDAKSSVNTPLQSTAGRAVPSEFVAAVGLGRADLRQGQDLR